LIQRGIRRWRGSLLLLLRGGSGIGGLGLGLLGNRLLSVCFVVSEFILGWGCVQDVGIYLGDLYELACMGNLEVF
jgi:hypothetical protein